MAFVQAKCENCGGFLTVDPKLKAANCPFCGAAYVVQDAINYYHSTTNIEHLHANVVNVQNDNSAEAKLQAAEGFLRIGDIGSAISAYSAVTEIKPQDYRGWLGLVNCNVKQNDGGPLVINVAKELDNTQYGGMLNSIKRDADHYNEVLPVYFKHYSNFKTFATPTVARELSPEWNAFVSKLKNRVDSYRPIVAKADQAYEVYVNSLKGNVKESDAKIAELNAKRDAFEKQRKPYQESKLIGALEDFTRHDIDSGFFRTIWVYCLTVLILSVVLCLGSYLLTKKFDLATIFLGTAITVLILGIATDISVSRLIKARERHHEEDSKFGSKLNELRLQIQAVEREKNNLLYQMNHTEYLDRLKNDLEASIKRSEAYVDRMGI